MASIVFFPSFLLIISAYLLVNGKNRKIRFNPCIIISIIIFTFVLGIRRNFGTDQKTYLHMYYYLDAGLQRCEFIFVKLNELLRKNNIPFQILFSIIAFIEIFFVFKVFEKENINFFLGFFFFYILYIFPFVNILRQAIAMSIVLLSFTYFYKKKFIYWFILVLIASGFHIASLTSLIIIPCISIFKKVKLNRIFYFFLLFFIFFFYEKLFSLLLELIFTPLSLIGGEELRIFEKFINNIIPLGTGLGVRLKIFAYICMIPMLIDYRDINEKSNFYFSIMMFGIVFEFFASLIMDFARIFMFYSFTQIIVLSKIVSKITKRELKTVKAFFFVFGVFILIFLGSVDFYKGIDTTKYYLIDLNFNLIENHNL